EIRQLHSEKNELMLQITRKNISLADAESKFSIKSEEMQAFQSKMKEEKQALQTRAEGRGIRAGSFFSTGGVA
ncbi:11921_t:CDS:2, partial [Funneliformis geosporum]